MPEQIDSGYLGDQDKPGIAPEDALVLFDGTSTDAFQTAEGKPISWPVIGGDKGSGVVFDDVTHCVHGNECGEVGVFVFCFASLRTGVLSWFVRAGLWIEV
ncbi:MAG: hypothetical protein AAF711_13480 [Planctomycetota bacterium]